MKPLIFILLFTASANAQTVAVVYPQNARVLFPDREEKKMQTVVDLLPPEYLLFSYPDETLLDASYKAVEDLSQRPGRKVLIILGNGAEHGSKHSRAEVLNLAAASHVRVYALVLLQRDEEGTAIAMRRMDLLDKLSEGKLFIPRQSNAVVKLISLIAKAEENHDLRTAGAAAADSRATLPNVST